MKKSKVVLLLVLLGVSVGSFALFRLWQHRAQSGEAPVISYDTELMEVSKDVTEEELLRGVHAEDAEDGDVTESLIVESVSRFVSPNTVKVTYAAFDSQNHVTKSSRSVRYTDYTPPRFTLSGPLVFTQSGVEDMLARVGAVDSIDGDLSAHVKVSVQDTASQLSSVGRHEVEFRVTNSKGGSSYLPATVETVTSDPNPAQIRLREYLVYLEPQDEFVPASYVEGYVRGGRERTGADGLAIDSAVDRSSPGVYTVTYSVDGSRTQLLVVVL